MAKNYGVHVASGTEFLTLSNVPSKTSSTWCCWCRYLTAPQGSWAPIICTDAYPPAGNGLSQIGWDSSALMSVRRSGGDRGDFPAGNEPKVGHWFWAGFILKGLAAGDMIGYRWVNSRWETAATTTGTGAGTNAYASVLNDNFNEWLDGEFAHLRAWSRVLSEAELRDEMNSQTVVSRKNLHTDILGYGDMRNRAPGGEWTYTAVSGGTVVTPISSDEIWFPKRLTVLAAGNASITNVSPSVLYEGLTNIVITGTGFGATQGTKTVYLDDKLQSIVSWTDTTITFNAVSPNLWNNARLLQVRGT